MLYSDLSISTTTYDFVNDFVYQPILGQELALLLKIYPLKKILSLTIETHINQLSKTAAHFQLYTDQVLYSNFSARSFIYADL
jgi:hypothetical protein